MVRSTLFLALMIFAQLARADEISSGTLSWVSEAFSSRADMLVLGDSVVWFGGDGWDAGFATALDNTMGLAGTGLIPNSSLNGEGEGYAIYGAWNGWSTSIGDVPANRQGYARANAVVSALDSPKGFFGYEVGGDLLDSTAAYDWRLYTASPPEGGMMGAFSRLGEAPWTRQSTIAPVPTATPVDGLQETIFHFPATSSTVPKKHMFLENTTNTSILYSRLLEPGATGATVTTWGYGGQSMLDFYQHYTSTMTLDGRAEWLSNMVRGGSGKLNVVIAEGFNDRNENETSLGGNTDGNSPEAFADNINGMIARVRADWAEDGNSPSDLSFTLLGMYAIDGDNSELRDFAAQLETIAIADDAISFVDLYEVTPSFEDADAMGYFADGIHLNKSGAIAYSQLVLDALTTPDTGDMNGDGLVDENDVPLFVMALTNTDQYSQQFPAFDPNVVGDFNGNGSIELGDVALFKAELANASGQFLVPEPSASLLSIIGILALCCRRRINQGAQITAPKSPTRSAFGLSPN